MSIFDEAIREHLDLKRKHGADDTELRKIEDEAFGPPARPDEPAAPPAAEAALAEPATEFLEEAPAEEAPEPPPPPAEEPPAMEHPTVEAPPEAAPEPAPEADIAPMPPPEPAPEPPPPPEDVEPAPESDRPAAEVPPEPPSDEAASIVDQPTELYDVGGEPGTPESPSSEDLVSEELTEPRLTPTEGLDADLEPPAELADEPAAGEGGEEEFFSEQSLSDELDRALDAPETEEAPAAPEAPVAPPDLEPEQGDEPAPPPPAEQQEEQEEGSFDQEGEGDGEDNGEDVLEETPEFLQETPEHDRLWFEQKPPKDFDFDD